jgi:hypothetical protein
MLRLGVENLLSGTPDITKEGEALARRIHAHPLIQALIRPRKKPRRPRSARGQTGGAPGEAARDWPSYIPARTFIAALLDSAGDAPAPAQTVAQVEAAIAKVPNAEVRKALTALLRRAGNDVGRFQRLAEEWFDDSMERVSGWYKRRVQVVLSLIATVLVLALNADSIRIAQNLWGDQSVRKTVVAAAGAETRVQREAREIDQIAQTVDELEELELPIGWDGDGWQGFDWFGAKLLGLLVSVAALTLGAPFWFDVLSKVARLRVSGAPPPTTDAIRKGEGEETRAGPTASAAPEEPHD